ncbi:LLM class F420-dependent oxidoreductase [Pseudonocardiaceae bacterium YIM PH 21723]|nr:LLM class F420-dependent oxidoreductase [Pseudonocardiaceae bacterium YIM PH 21723]
MRLGLKISRFRNDGGPATLGKDLARVVRAGEQAGFGSVSVMDHLLQIGVHGPITDPMLEAYTTLGFLAAHTETVELHTTVTATVYREPGLLAKIISTLDVLSGGRAWLGIGAAWFEEETQALGLPFPGLKERFERLEETLRICGQMWSDSEEPFHGEHYHLDRTLNVPQPLRTPPIMIGGTGEQKTLRLVAQYAQSCNFPGVQPPEITHKLTVLREHCDRLGTDYDAIRKTVTRNLDIGERGEDADKVVDELGALAEAGIQWSLGDLARVWDPSTIELYAERVIPQIEAF